MDFNNLNFLSRIGSIVQVTAIVLILLGGLLQASRFYIDKKINDLKSEMANSEKMESDHTIENLEETISEQSEKINLQNQEIETQKEKLKDLETKTKPRSIKSELLPQLNDELSKHKGEKIKITCVMGDQEALNFATEIKKLFLSSGWEVDGIDQAMYTNPIHGLIIVMQNESMKEKAEYIFKMLNHIGYKSVGEINNQLDNDVAIVVGSKKMNE